MANPLTAAGPIMLVGAVYVVLPVMLHAYTRFRGTRPVTCPSDTEAATVQLDAVRAGVTAAFGAPNIRISQCSRWPQRMQCGRGCLAQIQ